MANFVDIFNDKLLEFLRELKTSFPNITQFVLYESLTQGAIMMDKNLPQQTFDANVITKYGKHIEEKDESFLLEHATSSHVDETFVDSLKTIWRGLDDSNKQIIWSYIKLLVALNKKITS